VLPVLESGGKRWGNAEDRERGIVSRKLEGFGVREIFGVSSLRGYRRSFRRQVRSESGLEENRASTERSLLHFAVEIS